MKKIALIAGVALVTAIFAGCANNEDANPAGETTIHISLTAGIEQSGTETRTANPAAPVWTAGDAIGVHFVGDAPMNHWRLNGELLEGGQKATFSGNVTLPQGVSYTIYGYYPHGSIGGQTAHHQTAKIAIPAIQKPTATSFDPLADVMIMKPVERTFSGTSYSHNGLQFRRVLGMINFVLTCQELEGQAIKRLTFTTDAGLELAGMGHFDLDEGTFIEFYDGAATAITATPNGNVYANGTDGIMLCVPVMNIPAGTTLTITGETDNFTFEKTKTLDGAIQLAAGNWHTMNVTLEAEDVTVKEKLVTNITLSKSAASIEVGETLSLSANVLPSDATNRNVVWESSDTEVATVDQSGLVTAMGAGNAIITATATDGSGKAGSCSLTVTAADARTQLSYCIIPSTGAYTETAKGVGVFKITLQTFEGTSRPQNVASTKIGLSIYSEPSASKEIATGVYTFTSVYNTANAEKGTVYQSSLGRYDDNNVSLGGGSPTTNGTSTMTITKDGDNYTLLLDITYTSGNARTFKGIYTGPITF